MKILGIDEAGRGPVIGPMVIAGVIVGEKNRARLEKMGLKDSKAYTRKRREELFGRIVTAVDKYEILIINPPEIDAALNSPSSNLNWLEADKMIELIKMFGPEKVIADCPSTNTRRFTDYVRNRLEGTLPELVFEHKADENYPVVSAASILAKVTRDKSIDTLRNIYGDFGSGYMSDPKTRKFIDKDHTLPIYRKTWVTWKEVSGRKSQKSLGDF